ncbi:MAG TPA: hypothetical protein VGL65_02505 [Gemmatimonadales bacterium]
MPTQRTLAAAAIAATILLSAWRINPVNVSPTVPHSPTAFAPDACTLLTDADVTTALEVTTLPGKHVPPSSTLGCMWASDANLGAARRVTLSYSSVTAFDNAKSHPNTFFTVVPVSGVGDDAFYEVFKSDSPYLVVKQGTTVFTVRVLNGLKLKAFGLDQEKAKELVLGQAAVGRV